MFDIDINFNFNNLANKFVNAGKKLVDAFKISLIRGIKLYYEPLKIFNQIKEKPDILTPLSLLIIALGLHTLMIILLMENIKVIYPNGEEKTFIEMYNLSSSIALKFASIISLWFLSFIIFWFTLYFMKITIDGFIVFSASGYFLGSPFLIYMLSIIAYGLSDMTAPKIYLIYHTFLQHETYASATIYMKFYFAQKILFIPLYTLSQIFFWYGTLWTAFLSICLIKTLGETTWKKAIFGGLLSMAIIYLIESAFHAVGML